MRFTRWAVALILVPVIAAPPIGAAEGDPLGHGSGTDLRVEGDTLVLTLHLSIVYRGATAPQALLDGLAGAADYWNRGLARHPYAGCFNLRIELDTEFRHATQRDFDTTAHTIRTYGTSPVGEMADGRGLPSVVDRNAPPDLPATEDYAGPLEGPVEAYWPPWLFEDQAALAHEMGHLFGLGDDYIRDENGDTAPIAGREGTLMDSGNAIDSTLAARLGDNGIGAGYGDQFPECWTGTLTGTGTNSPPGSCEPAAIYDYAIKIVVGLENQARLTGHGITSSSCAATTTENDLALTGIRTSSGFTFPAGAFPGPLTIQAVGMAGTGRGTGSVDVRFSYQVEVVIEQQFGPPRGG